MLTPSPDAIWLLSQPSLMMLPAQRDGAAWIQRLATAPQPEPLTSQTRLGLYYEDLVAKALNTSEYIIETKRNTQLIVNGITKGEFDFLGTAQSKEKTYHFHLECAVKFYLLDGDADNLFHYVGTNRKDTLGQKWQRMLSHQSVLSETAEGAQCCQAHGHPTPRSLILIQGVIYLPLHRPAPDALAPAINPKALTGWWLPLEELDILLDSQIGYQLLVKPNWLSGDYPEKPTQIIGSSQAEHFAATDFMAPNAGNNHQQIYSAQELERLLENHFAQSKRAVHLRALTKAGQQWQEVSRGFVVANDWSGQ